MKNVEQLLYFSLIGTVGYAVQGDFNFLVCEINT